jgi:aminopeptidase YwaD
VDPAEDTDYIPFERKGEVITGFFERIRSTYPHSIDDTFANTDPVYIYKIGKATVGALQHFAVATSVSSIVLGAKETASNHSLETTLSIYPNPSKDTINIELPDTGRKDFSFEITDLSGKSLLKAANEKTVNVSGLAAGAYIGVIKADGQTAVRKILIER